MRDEATDEHQTSQLCMHELAQCRRLSRAATFVSLQSHKVADIILYMSHVWPCMPRLTSPPLLTLQYGYRPFPPQIEAGEFERMRECVSDPEDVALLDEWFRKDSNAEHVEYLLQVRHTQGYISHCPADRDNDSHRYHERVPLLPHSHSLILIP